MRTKNRSTCQTFAMKLLQSSILLFVISSGLTAQTPCSPPVYTETECYYNGGWWDWNSMQCYDCSGGGGGGGDEFL